MPNTKKAISPLIATVLLVGFAIVLAGLVSTFIIQKTKEFKPDKLVEDDLLCDNVAIDITAPNTNEVRYISISGTQYKFEGLRLKNKGSFTIHKILINSPGFLPSETPINPEIGLPPENPSDATTSETPIVLGVEKQEDESTQDISIIPIIKHPEQDIYIKCQRAEIKINTQKICTQLGITC